MSLGCLDALYLAMESHPGVEAVQTSACAALCDVSVSSDINISVIRRQRRAVGLIRAALAAHPQQGILTVSYWAELLLPAFSV